jgi:acyl-CoA thioester hydrolase
MLSEFSITRTVEFAETDMAGLMHFSNYFRWMEACEAAFYRSLRLPLVSFVPGNIVGWPRASASCHYLAPLRFNEVVEVRLFIKRLGTKSVTYVFHFRKGGELVAHGEVAAVCVTSDESGKMIARPIPAEVRAKLKEAPASAYTA